MDFRALIIQSINLLAALKITLIVFKVVYEDKMSIVGF